MDFDMNETSHDEYEMQCYEMHSNAIYDYIRSHVIDLIHKFCNDLSKSLEKGLENEEMIESVPGVIESLKKLYISNATPYLLRIKEKINNWLRIPDNILLPEDAKQSVQYVNSNIEYFKIHNDSLIKKLKKAHMFQAALKLKLESLIKVNEYYNNAPLLEQIDNYIEKINDCWINSDNPSYMQRLDNISKKIEHLIPQTEKALYNPNIDHIDLQNLE